MKPLLFALLCLLAPACPAGTPWRGTNLTAELTSEVESIRPGQAFYAGLFIQHDPGCHTYWLNPGLAGVPTKMEWSLPAGWTAGEIEWPTPDKVKMASVNTHGYERDVLLMVKITPPAAIKAKSGKVTLKTKASWMCCGQTCSPGWHDFTLTLPVDSGSAPVWSKVWRPVFEKERARLPVPVQSWKFSATRKGDKIILSGEPGKGARALPLEPAFYSSDNLVCSHPPQVWRKTATGFEAELEISNLPPRDATKLRGLLRAKGGWNPGDTRAVAIEVPLK